MRKELKMGDILQDFTRLNPDLPLNERMARIPTNDNKDRFTVKSGFPLLDKSTGGFQSRRTYVVGGLNKSGKSTFMMNILSNLLVNGEKIGVIDTEFGEEDFIKRFSAITNRIHEYDEANNEELQKNCKELFLDSGSLSYCYKSDILEDGVITSKKILEEFTIWRAKSGTNIFVIDNITTIQNSLVKNKAGYELLRSIVENLIDWAKDNNLILFLVLHTKGAELKFSESAERINQLIENKTPHKIFEKTVVVNTRPSVTSLYGGQSLLSQISGGVMLLWRPYQDFKELSYQRMTMLILEDWRSKPRTFVNEIELDFSVDESRYQDISRGIKDSE